MGMFPLASKAMGGRKLADTRFIGYDLQQKTSEVAISYHQNVDILISQWKR
jgi:hypothetical protein